MAPAVLLVIITKWADESPKSLWSSGMSVSHHGSCCGWFVLIQTHPRVRTVVHGALHSLLKCGIV